VLVVKVELHSAITGKVTKIAQMVIANDGTGDDKKGNYWCKTFRKNSETAVNRRGEVEDHPRLRNSVWNLVYKCLKSMEYDSE